MTRLSHQHQHQHQRQHQLVARTKGWVPTQAPRRVCEPQAGSPTLAELGFEDEMTNHCVGSLPELFDGNPPFKGRGAVSFAMNVAEMLRILKLLSKYNF